MPRSASVQRLASVLNDLTIQHVSNDLTDDIPTDAVSPSMMPGTSIALSVGDGDWVTNSDLESWGITREMATEIAEHRLQASATPSVEIVLVDATSRLFVVESDEPDIAALVSYLEQHIPVRPDAAAWIALGGDYVAVVSLDTTLTAPATSLMIDGAVSEYRDHGGWLRPALYRWNAGRLTLVVANLDSAAGRLSARATLLGDAVGDDMAGDNARRALV